MRRVGITGGDDAGVGLVVGVDAGDAVAAGGTEPAGGQNVVQGSTIARGATGSPADEDDAAAVDVGPADCTTPERGTTAQPLARIATDRPTDASRTRRVGREHEGTMAVATIPRSPVSRPFGGRLP
jgi:hypothetical protein